MSGILPDTLGGDSMRSMIDPPQKLGFNPWWEILQWVSVKTHRTSSKPQIKQVMKTTSNGRCSQHAEELLSIVRKACHPLTGRQELQSDKKTIAAFKQKVQDAKKALQ